MALCFCFLLGVGIFSSLENPQPLAIFLYLICLVCLFFIVFFWYFKKHRAFFLLILFFALGGLRFILSLPPNNSNEISYYNGETVQIVGVVKEVFLNDGAGKRYLVETAKVRRFDVNQTVGGKVLMRDKNNSEYNFGEKISFSCLLENPKNTADNFRYDRYLSRLGVWSTCSGSQISYLSSTEDGLSNKIIKIFYAGREKVAEKVNQLWSEPKSSLMGGILYGVRAGLPVDLKEDFNRVGITHIVAISGYNISVVVVVLQGLLLRLGFKKQKVFWLLTAGVIVFVLFSGASASVVRAGIMGIIVLLAKHLGRLSQIGNVLMFTAALMLLFNPYVLVWDAGFQLSFLATLGMVYLTPFLKKWPDFLQETLAAIFATLPLILFQFGRLSLVAPVVNVLVLWLIPYLMLFGFLAILFGFIFYPLGQVLAGVTLVGLKYLLFIAHWFAVRPWSAVDFTIPFWLMAVIYLYFFYIIYRKHLQRD